MASPCRISDPWPVLEGITVHQFASIRPADDIDMGIDPDQGRGDIRASQ